ncbi:16S rRNA (cytosine967-C5)-methyltransferase [Curtobacterium sp. UNCCL20]|uniref:RsmB/NOP family class I SAM-dependent RNA methyltransferase n=1 Tax=Curtobacterium sp. UNCCL20 TaxID=1502773 RepID=UPI00088B64C9|nr:transcription antitermination factor NusB [Curtobacterium sp. UNCCL20]SDQ88802.1 16S rRNA (cytosine967-C5)-methyltransferase [Curtobacterium sp. UNCCL20]
MSSGNAPQRGNSAPRSNSPQRRNHGPRQTSARRVAFDVLRAVQVDDAYANLLLPTRIRRAGLTARDAAFATELTYGTIRMLGRYDAIVALASGRRIDNIESDVLDVMRLGAHQLLGMRTPVHAAVSATVELAREVGAHRATGFVNAVLRKVGARADDEWDALITEGRGGDALLAARWSHPVWVVAALRDALAAERSRDELAALLAADNVAPRVQLAALPGIATDEDVAAATARAAEPDHDHDGDSDSDSPSEATRAVDAPPTASAPTDPGAETDLDPEAAPPGSDADHAPTVPDLPVSPVGIRGISGDPARVPGVTAGRLRVQDEGSQLAALALSRSSAVRPGERWLDLCAGPGGKAALLAAEAAQSGASLVANELVPARAGLVRKALAAFGDTVTVVEGDGRRYGRDGAGVTFDRVLLDAPCTGLGALRRRPEARWRKQPEDVPELAALQAELLDAAVRVLAPGGTLAYVTCSPHLAETRGQVDALMRRHGGVLEQVDTASVVRSVAARDPQVADGDTVQLWPHRIGTDAMFVALFRRVA